MTTTDSPKPHTSQDQVLVEATGMDLQAAHQADESSRAQSFMEKYRSRTFDARRHEAFHEFFELAAMLNESALALGITQVSLNAEGGEVNVTYQSQKVAHAPLGAKR